MESIMEALCKVLYAVPPRVDAKGLPSKKVRRNIVVLWKSYESLMRGLMQPYAAAFAATCPHLCLFLLGECLGQLQPVQGLMESLMRLGSPRSYGKPYAPKTSRKTSIRQFLAQSLMQPYGDEAISCVKSYRLLMQDFFR